MTWDIGDDFSWALKVVRFDNAMAMHETNTS